MEALTTAGDPLYGGPVLTIGRSRAVLVAARLLAVIACALAASAVALPVVSGYGYLDRITASPEVSIAVSFSLTGALLVGSVPARRMGWLLLAIGTSAATYSASLSWAGFLVRGDPGVASRVDAASLPWAAWLSSWAWFPAWLLVSTVLLQVIPYGRPLPHPFWRVPLWAAGIFMVVGTAAFMVTPGQVGPFEGVDNPMGSELVHGWIRPVEAFLDGGVMALLVVSLLSTVLRIVRADGVERRQVGWVGYAVAVVVLVVLLAPSVWVNLVVLLVPAGIAVAALRYRLYDLDVLVNRTLVAAVLVAGAAVVYVALVAWVGALAGRSGGVVPFVAAFAVALVFHPARIRVQRQVDRLFHGRRGDPYALLRDLDRTLRHAATPTRALASAAEVVREGLRLPGVAVQVPRPPAEEFWHHEGQVGDDAVPLPLELHGEQVGRLLVTPRRSGEGLAQADLRVLQALGGPLASAAYALRVSGDLAESHRALLDAREDERRRLRRDLHDGLGPQLAGIAMGLDVVGSTLARGRVDEAGEIARATTDLAREAVDDVRRLVRGLRPPALDELGLVAALEAACGRPGGVSVEITTSGQLGGLPAAVEVATYRIVVEAVTNAIRHGGCSRVEVTLDSNAERLLLVVCDDGRGLPDPVLPGVGLTSMRERAEELGGWCRVVPGRGGRVSRPSCGWARGADVGERLRVVVADDHPVFRQGLRMLLEDLGVEVVAEAEDGDGAVAAVLRERPDVVLMDLQMPGTSGLEATRRLVAEAPDVRVLVLSMVDEDEAVFAAVQAGAAGYLLKGSGQADIRRALEAVAAGQSVFGPEVGVRLRGFLQNGPAPVAFPMLSSRERDVLGLVGRGLANAEVASRLHLSEKTVRNYVSSIFTKLDVTTRAEAIVRAREAGLSG